MNLIKNLDVVFSVLIVVMVLLMVLPIPTFYWTFCSYLI